MPGSRLRQHGTEHVRTSHRSPWLCKGPCGLRKVSVFICSSVCLVLKIFPYKTKPFLLTDTTKQRCCLGMWTRRRAKMIFRRKWKHLCHHHLCTGGMTSRRPLSRHLRYVVPRPSRGDSFVTTWTAKRHQGRSRKSVGSWRPMQNLAESLFSARFPILQNDFQQK